MRPGARRHHDIEAAVGVGVVAEPVEFGAVEHGAVVLVQDAGGDEESDQTTLDKQLDHPGVAITVSTGDNGYGTEYPATSRFVTAVGGSTHSAAKFAGSPSRSEISVSG